MNLFHVVGITVLFLAYVYFRLIDGVLSLLLRASTLVVGGLTLVLIGKLVMKLFTTIF